MTSHLETRYYLYYENYTIILKINYIFRMKLRLFICILGYVSAQSGYEFAADTEGLLNQPLVKDFSCEGRDYGYYADVANACQVFHICWPKYNELEEQAQ